MTSHNSSPNTQSDTQWLHEKGYLNGIRDFMEDYGFADDEEDDALTLFRQFRDEQQEAWEKLQKEKPKSVAENLILFMTSFSYNNESSIPKKRTGTGIYKGNKA
ncbi:hypothetical protein NHQ30_004677 [Ciborinia camelliae]|nr:hypothetical protein NHQ30_004677 [Ciborinia camelliae]